MMEKYIEKLKDPNLVAAIQKFFGIWYVKEDLEQNNSECVKHDTQLGEIQTLTNEHDKTGKDTSKKDNPEHTEKCVHNKFWYYLFLCATYIGDEVGYALFLPFWFWNINNNVGKKIILVWTLIMYVGQAVKDVVCWPRPSCPPVIRLQKKWSLEYGMPSTHAMVAVAIPASVIYYTSDYDYPIEYAIVIAVFLCALISFSRLYLGMHCVLDIIVGLLLSALLLIPIIPVADALCDMLMKFQLSPLILILSGIILIMMYPTSKVWTPTRGDTTTILGTCVGIEIACWAACNFQTATYNSHSVDHSNLWKFIGITILRTIIGYCGMVSILGLCKVLEICVDFVLKKLSWNIIDTETKRHVPVLDLTYKYTTYIITSFVAIYVMPLSFQYLNIGRQKYVEKC